MDCNRCRLVQEAGEAARASRRYGGVHQVGDQKFGEGVAACTGRGMIMSVPCICGLRGRFGHWSLYYAFFIDNSAFVFSTTLGLV